MKREHILPILFFGTIWGAAEVILGGALYRAHVPYPSVPLTVIAFVILTVGRAYLPQAGSSTLIAGCAMLYKFLNTPFFACHLLGIFLIGLSYDLVRSRFKIRNDALFAVTATYVAYSVFAVTITYVFRYAEWNRYGLPGVLHHVGIVGTMAAVGNAVLVPLTVRLLRRARAGAPSPLFFGSKLRAAGSSMVMAALWIAGVTVSF